MEDRSVAAKTKVKMYRLETKTQLLETNVY